MNRIKIASEQGIDPIFGHRLARDWQHENLNKPTAVGQLIALNPDLNLLHVSQTIKARDIDVLHN